VPPGQQQPLQQQQVFPGDQLYQGKKKNRNHALINAFSWRDNTLTPVSTSVTADPP